MKHRRKYRLATGPSRIPLWLAELYLFGTFGMFLMGPLCQQAVGLGTLISFVVACHLAFLGGYVCFSPPSQCKGEAWGEPERLMRWAIVLSILWTASYYILHYMETSDGFSSIVQRVTNPGASYRARRDIQAEYVQAGPTNRFVQVQVLLSGLGYCMVPFCILAWSRLGTFVKFAFGVATFIVLIVGVATGTNQPIGLLAVQAAAALLIRWRGQWMGLRSSLRNRDRSVLLLIGICIVFFTFMGFNLLSRNDAYGVSDHGDGVESIKVVNLPGMALLPPRVQSGISLVWFYLSHGYCGLSYSLQTPFQWTCGVGAARGMQTYIDWYLGIRGVLEETYPLRAEVLYGWPGLQYWCTMYPWLASDVTFPGVVMLMFGLGWLYAKTWYESTILRDPISVLVFSLIFLTIVFAPANLQILISRNDVWTVLAVTVCYCFRSAIRVLSSVTHPLQGTSKRDKPAKRDENDNTRTV